MSKLSFKQYYSKKDFYLYDIDEGFFDSMKQGFNTQYAQARGSKENDQDLEKYAQKALPAIQKAREIAQKYAQKTGIPIPLATAIIAAGIVGGATAVPFATLMYFVRKPINNMAGKAFDAGAQKMGWMPQQQAPAPQVAWNTNSGFYSYLEMRDLEEGWMGDKFNQAKTWWNEKGADQVGGAIGKAAGAVSGKTVKYSANISNMIKSSWNALSQFVSENKLAIGKAAFLMAVGAAVGAGVGAAANAVTQGTDVVATTAVDALKETGQVPPQEMDWIEQNFKPKVTANADGNYEVSGEELYSTTGKFVGGDGITDTDTMVNTGDLLKTTNDELNNSDILSSFTTTQPVEGPHPGYMVLQVHGTITPQPGQGAEEVLKMAQDQIRQQLEKAGVTVQDFKQINYDPATPEAPIQVTFTTTNVSNLPGAAAGGAIGGAAGGAQPQGRLQKFGSWLSKVNRYGLPSKNKTAWQ